MREKIIEFFIKRHLLTNLIFVSVLFGGVIAWNQLQKEELPDVTFDTVHVSVRYPGASAEEVEYFVTRPIEESIRSLDGIYSIASSTGIGNSSVRVEIDRSSLDRDEVITEIRNAVLDVDLPEDITDDPNVRVFKTSRKAIIDVGLIIKGKNILDVESRKILQAYAFSLEHKLLTLPQVSLVQRSGYLDKEIQIKVYPQKLYEYQIPFNMVMREVINNNVRQPAGSIESIKEPKVTLFAQLDTIESLEELAIQGGFEGQVVHLSDVADVEEGFKKSTTIAKINGHEGIFLNITKSSQAGIIEAIDAVNSVVDDFSKNNLKDSKIKIVLLDDESIDVRNRLSLITFNGIIGFILIVIILFLFLDFNSGFWVAMGIPFTFCFTLFASLLMGYSINNITLAAVIIVMGMVVDDAIVVSENITRLRLQGLSMREAGIKGTSYVFLPIIASILTTCAAFVPLFFFSGHFGVMVVFIPPIVFFMLGGSLIEALFVLPGHMVIPFAEKMHNFISKIKPQLKVVKLFKKHICLNNLNKKNWFNKWEERYGKFIEKLLPHKLSILAFFIVFLVFSLLLAKSKMKYVMFPGEETRQISLSAEAPPGTKRYETALLSQSIEDVLSRYIDKEVVGFRTRIARSRRGSAAQENMFRMNIEIVPKEKRKKSADQLISEWEKQFVGIKNIKKIKLSKSWHGQSSESPIEILVKENNNELRRIVSDELAQILRKQKALTNIEVDRPVVTPEYRIKLNRDKVRRLAINPSDVARTLRAGLEGTILYDFMGDDEQVYVRLTTVESQKNDIEDLLNIPVENQGDYLVPLREIVTLEEISTPDSIERYNEKRTTLVYADLVEGVKQSPLEIGNYLEENIFPLLIAKYPSSILEFGGEVKDTRESQKSFNLAIIMVLFLIYTILALLFNSVGKPFIIMLSIPFSLIGVIIAFWMHGIMMYGLFAVIGVLGLSGVVVNDAIIMIVKLDKEYDQKKSLNESNQQIASISKTRLRAVILTTLTTVAGIVPTAYGWAGYDSMLAQMMLALCWGLVFGTMITLVLIPCVYSFSKEFKFKLNKI